MKHVVFMAMASIALVGCHRSKMDKPEICKILVNQVVDGQRVLEINNVKVMEYSPRAGSEEYVTCSGDAITVAGDKQIEFGLVRSPQGKPLVATRFPE